MGNFLNLRGSMPETVLQTTALTRVYRVGRANVTALGGIDFAVHAGETLAIMGPSGCGKSTLLNLLGGLDRPTSGHIRVGGRELGGLSARELALLRRRDVGFVFQAHNLLATLTAVENVALPLVLNG